MLTPRPHASVWIRRFHISTALLRSNKAHSNGEILLDRCNGAAPMHLTWDSGREFARKYLWQCLTETGFPVNISHVRQLLRTCTKTHLGSNRRRRSSPRESVITSARASAGAE